MKTKPTTSKFLSLAPKSAGEIKTIADKALVEANAELKELLSVPKDEKRTVENTFEPLNEIARIIGEASHQAQLFSMVHPDKKIRDAGEAAVQKLAEFSPKLYLRKDVYQALKDVSMVGLDEIARRFQKKEITDFKMTGVEASPKDQREIKQLIKKMVKLGQTFERNIKDDVRYTFVSQGELNGMPEDYIKSHKPDDQGRVRLSTQYPDYVPFMQYAESESARRKFYDIYANRAWPKNDAVLKSLLVVRQRLANILGFKDWADYVTVTKMTGSGNAVQKFLDQVGVLTEPTARKDHLCMLARKKKDDPAAKEIHAWELSYYDNILAKELVGLDSQVVREYFSFPNVKDGLFRAMGRLFGLSYRRVSVPLWHKDAEAYDVFRGKKLIGRFYLDLHPRGGKFNHACCQEVHEGVHGKQLPEATLICNFSRDLMSQSEVETFFHEFGHLMHYIIAGDQRWVRFSGYATEWDFVEAPSQMLESWALDLKTLKTFARHYKTGKLIPDSLVDTMRHADSLNRGFWQRRQLYQAALSLVYYREKSPRTMNLASVMQRVSKKYNLVGLPSNNHFYAAFGHLDGYSAIYYTYLWSHAIAEEILGPFKKNGMYDKKTAQRYRDMVLAPGGSKDGRQLLRDFLGREWNLKAFEKWLKV